MPTKSKTYEIWESGEWCVLPRRGTKLMCCDCHLTHVLNFKIKDGKIYMQVIRDDRATAAARRKR